MNAESRIQLERRIVAALCNGTAEGWLRDAVRTRLATYSWTDPAHRAIFEIVTGLPSTSADLLREQLPARLTRRGFPDFDFARLFSAPIAARQEVENWVVQLANINS